MRIASRISNLVLLVSLGLLVAASATAGGPRHVGPGHKHQPKTPVVAPGADVEIDRDRRPIAKRRALRGCHRRAPRGPKVGCAYYYDDDGEYYDENDQPMRGWSPDQPLPGEGTAPAAPKTAPSTGIGEDAQTYSPHGGKALKERLISGRKHWLQKKGELDDANAALARAEYQVEQTGKPIAPRLIERQKQAQQEADAAHAALAPLVEEGRAGGISPKTLELYDRANESY